MRSVPLRMSCLGPVLRLACLGGGGAARSRFPLRGLGLRAPRGVGAGVGTRHQPHRAHSCELAWRAVGAARGRPGGGGGLCLGVGRPGSGALPPPTILPFGRAAGAHYPLAVGAGGAGVGTRHQPHNACSCELALRAVEAARGRPGGAPLAWVWGVRGRALSHPRPLVLSGVRPGPNTHWLWVRGVRAWGPVTNPTARALASWLCALWGRHEGARGGAPLAWASGIGRSPIPDSPSFGACGRGALPTGCGCGGCGPRDPSPTPQGALLRAGFARCGGGTRAPRGGRLLPGCGASGVGRYPTSDRPSLGACGRAPLPTGCGCGGCGRGDPSPTPQRALFHAGLARCGGGTRAPSGGHLLPGCGASRVGRSLTPDNSSFRACGRGPLSTGCGCGGAGVGTRHQPHSARSCELALRVVGAA